MEVGYFTMPLHPPGSNLTKTLEDDLEPVSYTHLTLPTKA